MSMGLISLVVALAAPVAPLTVRNSVRVAHVVISALGDHGPII